ncbi:NHERF family PDZ scaffold protein 4b [Aplochiton taeniatus]
MSDPPCSESMCADAIADATSDLRAEMRGGTLWSPFAMECGPPFTQCGMRGRLVEVIELTERFTFNPKEGIDNPAMIISDDPDYVSTPMLRPCVLKADEDGSFGFHLRIERGCQGHVIRNVVALGPAERSSLRDGDRLLEVNETFVDDVSHPEVARHIRRSGAQLCLLVLDGQEYDQALSRGEDLRALAKAHRGESTRPPRLCHITSDPDSGLGISFTPVEGGKGRFSVSLLPGSAAERAGVCHGDRLVWMNGAAVSEISPSALGKMVKKCEDHMTVMVIDMESEQSYITRRTPILPAMAHPTSLPHRPKKLHLVLGPTGGYGFLLRQECTPSGRIVHVLLEVDTGGPAEKAGMKEGDLLLEVNGESVDSLEHEEVVHRVRQNQQVTLTTITNTGLQFHSQKDPMGFGFGFNVGFEAMTGGVFISQVVLGSPGKKAGLLEGDVLIQVNGQNVEDKCLEDVIILVKEGGNLLSLLVTRTTTSK